MENAKYLLVSAEPRYWEDADYNGQNDEDGSLAPCKFGDNWQPFIDIKSGQN